MDINNLKKEMNDKFVQLFNIIQQIPLLANIKLEILERIEG
jgi:hypothetical protein